MPPRDYIIYTLRGLGFVGNAGQATTDRAAAKTFTKTEAIEFAKRQVDHNGTATMYPIHLDMLDEIENKE